MSWETGTYVGITYIPKEDASFSYDMSTNRQNMENKTREYNAHFAQHCSSEIVVQLCGCVMFLNEIKRCNITPLNILMGTVL